MNAPAPERACFRKARYDSEAMAEAVARRCLRERGDALRVYACTECGGYHLTSMNAHRTQVKAGWRPARVSARDEANERHVNRVRGRRR